MGLGCILLSALYMQSLATMTPEEAAQKIQDAKALPRTAFSWHVQVHWLS